MGPESGTGRGLPSFSDLATDAPFSLAMGLQHDLSLAMGLQHDRASFTIQSTCESVEQAPTIAIGSLLPDRSDYEPSCRNGP